MEIRLSDDNEYLQWLQVLKERIRSGKLAAALAVNREMLQVQWEIGAALSEKQQRASWGDKVITQLAKDLSGEFGAKGFSSTQLKYMRRWYQFYNPIGLQAVDQLQLTGNELVTTGPQAVDQNPAGFPDLLGKVPWGHHIQIFTKSASIEEAAYYLQQTVRHNWPRKMLVHQMEADLFRRKGRAITNFDTTMPKPQSELAREIFKNPYQLGFLDLAEDSSERDLENAIINNIIRFLQELGPSFALIGRQYHLQVSDKDYILDLLFYHTRLHCYLVIELKITDFKPEFAGKLEFYINAVDDQIKTENDNPTIGLLLCKTADEVIVEYSLRSKTKPITVSEYTHNLPKELRKELPAVADLKKELSKEIVLQQKPVDEKLGRLRQIISRINAEEAQQEKNRKIYIKLYDEFFLPLTQYVKQKCEEFREQFHQFTYHYSLNNGTKAINEGPLEEQWSEENSNLFNFTFSMSLRGFKKGGLDAFDVYQNIEAYLDQYRYTIGPSREKKFAEKLYHQFPDQTEREELGDMFFDMLIEQIEANLNRIYPGLTEID